MKEHHKGIHHITAVAGNPQRNAQFYVHTLGMRMVKKSVNQDAPDTYHFFYGNREGSPGTDLSFFPWPQLPQGQPSAGQATVVSLAVPPQSKDFWTTYLNDEGIEFNIIERFDTQRIRFKDPDQLQLELVFDEQVEDMPGWDQGVVPAEHTIRGFHGTTLSLRDHKNTALILEELIDFEQVDQNEKSRLFTTDAPVGGSLVIEEVDSQPSRGGRGSVHHVAFRAKDKAEQEEMRKKVLDFGLRPSPIVDRHWFHSMYFRSPGGVLFEIASDGPGFTKDEDLDELGHKLVLTPKLEKRREEIEANLPEINV